MESRSLRYFVAVAEELNFARAAERLGISPPPLSRAIRRLEAELGVTLFERTTHRVARTPAGDVLLAEARVALDALEAAGRRARRAAEGPKLVLAVKADGDAGLLEPILARYASEPDAVPVAVRLCGWQEQPRLLRAGEADVALVHAPFDGTGLDTETLAAEPRVAVLAADHPLAARDRLELADLGLDAGSVERHIDEARRGHDDLAQVLTAVSLGKVVTLLPASVTARYPRPGVVYRPVPEAPPVVLALAWPERSRSTATAALVRVAAEVAEAARNGA
ncbi:LysR family transcriptional regulator [Streptomyces violaceoruber]|uniref:LysR-family transcriptional regulator n=8 Tax=Streptomyces TaxID=1883 RepID=Q9RCY3_STRCO|nr:MULTISPECIES: LysR family transcriptional regulator [Streptomyces]QSJ13154.1 LysR family transcriptional regulator [Streptomyces lividans]AIJ17543.1 LysR family transcriptional regulator [Streptomyces lividans TK24]EFD71029.1 LysR family transcriptional regulator [Streptomyces lividans TK24]EOY45875.1 Aromatic hydrocarbon utilization transcriptional regulator CatR (LysR family) [Streptomyces lividans 1326]KKD10724.1 LysR family transcriptional regulator [Streptomyces sp. WM6391]